MSVKWLKVAGAALNQTPLDWDGNRRRILEAVCLAREAGAGLLCLPELCITGYGCEDAFHSAATPRMAARVLREIAPETRGLVVSVGLPLLHRSGLFNAAALLADGRVAGFACKRHLAGEGIHYEPRWFKPWPPGTRGEIDFDGAPLPVGDWLFEVGGVRIGFEICEDAWVADRPGAAMARQGVDVVLHPSASHFAFDKRDVRRRYLLDGARAFGANYIYANLLGNEAGRAIYDGGVDIASGGRLLASGPRFSFREVVMTCAVLDLDLTRMSQARAAALRPEVGAEGIIRVPFEFSKAGPAPAAKARADAAWESTPRLKEEEFSRAMALGLFDYMRKSRSNGFVVSISGGADSAAVSTLCALMVELGAGELGAAGLAKRLNHIAGIGAAREVRDFVRLLLVCVYQSTRNSSKATRDAAAAVAEGLGAEFREFDVEGLVRTYVDLAGGAVGRALDWGRDDLALQNIQARVRAPGVWLLANVRGALLLATSNRSEAAVGYATMDGDTCGGLSPIAGIDKAFLREWLKWMEREGPSGARAFPELASVNGLEPTAELRPLEQRQTDEADLMPYPVLDAIERAAIRDKQAPLDAWRLMRERFPSHRAADLALWVERFFRLWCRNQWKRERYAPCFHLDDENLDPKTWCRFPILSGGFERELAELREAAAREAAD